MTETKSEYLVVDRQEDADGNRIFPGQTLRFRRLTENTIAVDGYEDLKLGPRDSMHPTRPTRYLSTWWISKADAKGLAAYVDPQAVDNAALVAQLDGQITTLRADLIDARDRVSEAQESNKVCWAQYDASVREREALEQKVRDLTGRLDQIGNILSTKNPEPRGVVGWGTESGPVINGSPVSDDAYYSKGATVKAAPLTLNRRSTRGCRTECASCDVAFGPLP